MNKDYVLIMKVKKLTENQVCNMAALCRKEAKKIAPGKRVVIGIEQKGGRS
ncbi:MAG: hypothetical protein J5857_08700 [Treponema sp.]|nr:hypothetical protein [Treponema sp.]